MEDQRFKVDVYISSEEAKEFASAFFPNEKEATDYIKLRQKETSYIYKLKDQSNDPDYINALAIENRRKEYPPIEMYLDGIVKNDQAQVDEYKRLCLAVKQKYPKTKLSFIEKILNFF